jgi:hypothetical protein
MVDIPDYPSLVTQGGLGYASFPNPTEGNAAPGPPLDDQSLNPPAPLEAVGFPGTVTTDAPENTWNCWTAAPGGKWDHP